MSYLIISAEGLGEQLPTFITESPQLAQKFSHFIIVVMTESKFKVPVVELVKGINPNLRMFHFCTPIAIQLKLRLIL